MADRLNGALQENLITVLAHDPVNGKLVAQLCDPQLFEGEYRDIAERCIDYWDKHKRPPGVHMADLVGDILDDPRNRKAKTYDRILRNMEMLVESVNTDYVLTSLRNFTRVQHMKDAILKAAEKLNAQQELAIGEVEEMLADLLRARELNFDPGLRLTEPERVIEFLRSHYSEFRTGIEAFDRKNIVPTRGAVVLFLAPTGRGKTWFLIHCGKMALMLRKKVCHITLELGEEPTAQRYYQDLFSIPKHAGVIDLATLSVHEKTHKVKQYGHSTHKPKMSFDDGNIAKELKKQIAPWKHRLPNLIIKRFPMRALTMNGLRAYLDALEATEGFIPDMIILDYIGVCATDAKNHRISLGRVMEDFRAVCTERNAAGVTAHQTSKISADAEVVKATHVAEDWSLIATSDIAMTYSQTAAENRLGLARLFVDKSRDEEDKFGVIVTQSYKLGQFVLQSALLDKDHYDYLREVKKEEDEEADDDDVERE